MKKTKPKANPKEVVYVVALEVPACYTCRTEPATVELRADVEDFISIVGKDFTSIIGKYCLKCSKSARRRLLTLTKASAKALAKLKR